jgi:hypothetical protein
VALVNALLELGAPKVARYGDKLAGLEAALAALRPFGVEGAAACTGIAAADVRGDRARAARGSLRGRLRAHGVSTQPFGSVCMWLIQLVNIVTGNLDAVGGALCTQPLVPLTGPGTRPRSLGKYRTRVSAARYSEPSFRRSP